MLAPLNPGLTSTAIITGASSGLGSEYARLLAADQSLHLVLAARRTDRLEALATELRKLRAGTNPADGSGEQRVTVVTCDLRDTGECEKLLEHVRGLNLPVTWLINNAGFGSLGQFSESDRRTECDMVRLNCIAPLYLCQSLLPQMTRAKRSAIVNVCSTAAYQAMPYMATYGATKAFLLNLSVALAAETRRTGLTVLAHCPGPTDTEFHLVVGLEDKLSFLPAVSARKVVEQALDAAVRGRTIYINGWLNFPLAQLNRVFPRLFAARLIELALRGEARRRVAGRATPAR